MASPFTLLLLFLLHLLHLTSEASAQLVLEEGYTVSTVLDGNKLNINPFSVLPRPGTHDLFILDSANNVFYTVSSSVSQDSEINRFSGKGIAGFQDGDSASAMFDNPRSFAVDLRGNVYVADQKHNAIRKISKSGVTTIAGGHSEKPGHADGPAQNASFSADFCIVFVPERCALLISDHGNRLIRQMNLKPEDCARSNHLVLGMTWVWMLGLGVFCLLGLVVFLAARLYVNSREISGRHCFSETWKHCQINLERRVPIIFFDIRSAIASSTPYILFLRLIGLSLSHLSLMFRIPRVENQCVREGPISLLDSDCASNYETKYEAIKSQIFADQLKDLMSFDVGPDDASEVINRTVKQGVEHHEKGDVLTCYDGERIDSMIQGNILDFANEASKKISLESSMGSSVLIKRK